MSLSTSAYSFLSISTSLYLFNPLLWPFYYPSWNNYWIVLRKGQNKDTRDMRETRNIEIIYSARFRIFYANSYTATSIVKEIIFPNLRFVMGLFNAFIYYEEILCRQRLYLFYKVFHLHSIGISRANSFENYVGCAQKRTKYFTTYNFHYTPWK